MIDTETRICPNCKAEYKDKNVTICLKCGYPTIKKVINKSIKKDVRIETPLGE